MTGRLSETNIFFGGAARFHDMIYVITQDRRLAADEIEHSCILAYDQGEWFDVDETNWNAVAICIAKKPAEKMVAIGENGEVLTAVGGKEEEEVISSHPTVLRGIGVVDGFPLACGMKRQVYRRVLENQWVAMHAPEPKKDEIAGFEAIAGFGSDEIYAVGWNGEIWQWNGNRWMNRKNPTNQILTGVCCADDSDVYVCGQNGTLIRGRNDGWKMIDLGDFKQDFWDLCWFKGTLYLASLTMLLTYSKDGLAAVPFGSDRPRTCYRLTQAEGVLWSIGTNDVFSFNGTNWIRIN